MGAAHLGKAHNPRLLLSPTRTTTKQTRDHLHLPTCQQTPSSCHLSPLRMVCFQRCCCCVNLRTGGLMMGVMTLALSAFSIVPMAISLSKRLGQVMVRMCLNECAGHTWPRWSPTFSTSTARTETRARES